MKFHLTAAVLVAATTALAQQDPQVADADLSELSLEQLMELPVDVANHHTESLASSAASVFVLTAPEIRRSGMRSVPELLRLVPGLVIAQDVPGAYGFSSRLGELEFSGMLVLLDGQRLYTTLLRREYWQAIDLPVEIIERIEVVKGPGGARWGDKATQGVINIVTKRADKAEGGRVAGLVGSEERLLGTFRYGMATGENSGFYVFAKEAQRDGGHPKTAGDRWTNRNFGARFDGQLAEHVELTCDTLIHDSFLGDSYVNPPGYASLNQVLGGHAKAKLRWAHDAAQWTEARVAFDAYDQDILDYDADVRVYHLRYREQLVEAALQHTLPIGDAHQLTFGASVRQLTVHRYEVFGDDGAAYNETRGDLFAQWDWRLGEHVKATIGANLGYQDALHGSGVDTQPDLRLAWTPSSDFTVWSALSANREPDRKYPDSGLLVSRRSSRLVAWELGARRRFDEVLMLQADAFVYEIDHQENDTTTDPGSGATLFVTDGETDAFGGELTVSWNPTAGMRLTSWLAFTEGNSQRIDPASYWVVEDTAPRLRGGATFGYDPLPGLELDTNLLYTQGHAGIDPWWRLDLRCAWRPTENTTFELVGQNLTESHHVEYFYSEAAERGLYFMVTQRF
ncbi:MAG: TonB-dependent receptor [Planctomycetes bacterium]|nr:TonB-dependent receptor [Planctomycetota bacterium]